jgi:hypothetical protein
MVGFIYAHRAEYGVEPICEELPIAPPTYYEVKPRERYPERLPGRTRRAGELAGEVQRVRHENSDVDGAHKTWRQ